MLKFGFYRPIDDPEYGNKMIYDATVDFSNLEAKLHYQTINASTGEIIEDTTHHYTITLVD